MIVFRVIRSFIKGSHCILRCFFSVFIMTTIFHRMLIAYASVCVKFLFIIAEYYAVHSNAYY